MDNENTPQQTTVSGSTLPSPFYALVVAGSDQPSPDDGNVYRFQNGNLTFIGRPTTQSLRQVAWRPGGAYALIVGFGATILKFDGTNFTPLNSGIPASKNFHAVSWRPDGAVALIAGSSGIVLRYDGFSFSQISTGVVTTVRSISWRSNSYATLVGAMGTVLTYENGQIQQFISGTTRELYTVSWNPNSLYALVGGSDGTILRHDGFVNTALNTSGIYNPSHVIRSIGWNNTSLALISGDTGLVLTYNGTVLVRQLLDGSENATQNHLQSLDWFQGNATIVGGHGTTLEFSGMLRKITNSTNAPLKGIDWRPYVPMSVNFTANPAIPSSGNPATFSAMASGGLSPYAFTWDFADGTVATGNPVSHSFSVPGNFSVVLTATDSEGATAAATKIVTVSPWPPSLFEFDWADFDNDGQVSILDLSVIALCYGSTPSATSWPGCIYWDLDLNQKISIIDVAYVAFYYGTSYPPPFPGQADETGHMDELWDGFCFVLPPIDQQYCLAMA